MPSRLAPALAATLVSVALAASGCGSSAQPNAGGSPASGGTTVTVFAAASMKATFTTLGRSFETTHAGTRVAFNFAGSQTLAAQITQGAAADVFASADEASMAIVTGAGLNSGVSRRYATNRLSIAVPPDNPAGIAAFADLAKPGLKLVICAAPVPCGAATLKLQTATGVTLTPVSEEQSVTDVLAKVEAGEADAGLVYSTDVIAAGEKVRGIAFSEAARAINSNSIVALKASSQAAPGQQFVDLVLSADGQKVLAEAGFGAAP